MADISFEFCPLLGEDCGEVLAGHVVLPLLLPHLASLAQARQSGCNGQEILKLREKLFFLEKDLFDLSGGIEALKCDELLNFTLSMTG